MPQMTIIAATDFSPTARAAVERAALIARDHGAALHLLYVLDGAAWTNMPALVAPAKPVDSAEAAKQAGKKLGSAAIRLARKYGISATAKVVHGKPSEALDAAANSLDAALVVLGPHSSRLSDRLYMGSTALGTVRRARCPVLVVRNRPKNAYRRALVAVDFSASSSRAAVSVATWFPAMPIGLLHAVQAVDGPMLLTAALREALESAKVELREQAEQRLADWFPAGQPGQLDLAARCTLVAQATPALLREVKTGEYDLLALGRDAGSEFGERVLGSVPANMLTATPVDVLLVP